MNTLRLLGWGIAAWSILAAGCASFQPQPLDQSGFERRAQFSTDGRVTVSVAALTEKEARDVLGVDLAGAGIQPVWVKVANQEAVGFTIPPIIIDPEYFSPMEAAWQAHGWLSGATNARIDAHFRALRLPRWVGPGETVSGFVFTNLDEGFKYVSVELTGSGVQQARRFNLLANQDMQYSHSLSRHAHAKGVGAATIDSPRFNYTGDPYWTDGLRLVMWLSAEPVNYHQAEAVQWEAVPAR